MSSKLSKDDTNRVNACDYYKKSIEILASLKAWSGLSVGEVYFIKTKRYSNDWYYETSGYGDQPSKFMVFHKDDQGFVFIKRIIASGNLGKEVRCLTTQYNPSNTIIEADPEYVNSILLDDEDGYDPLAAAKETTSKKNKARRRNKKIELSHPDAVLSQRYVQSLKVGDKLHDALTAYGTGVIEWTVKSIENRPTDKKPDPYHSSYGNAVLGSTVEDRLHNEYNLSQMVAVEIEAQSSLPKSRKYTDTKRTVTFYDFFNHKWRKYYSAKPFTIDDV